MVYFTRGEILRLAGVQKSTKGDLARGQGVEKNQGTQLLTYSHGYRDANIWAFAVQFFPFNSSFELLRAVFSDYLATTLLNNKLSKMANSTCS